jgi:hypothetical protein
VFNLAWSKRCALLNALFASSLIVVFLFVVKSKLAISEEVCYLETETGNRLDLNHLCGANQPTTPDANQSAVVDSHEPQQLTLEEKEQVRRLNRENPEAAKLYVRNIVCRLNNYSEDDCPIDSSQIVISNALLQ